MRNWRTSMTSGSLWCMNAQDIVSAIDAEIARLQSARSLLAGTVTKLRGRRRKSEFMTLAPALKRRTLSSAARKKIAAAQRKRWAKQKAAK
jgi:hypothetical protein